MMTTEIEKKTDEAVQPTRQTPRVNPRVSPQVDIYENDKEFLIVADMPGVKPGEVDARLHGGELRILAEQAGLAEADGFVPARFERAFRVPEIVDAAGVRAELREGVLRVHLAKTASAQPRQIKVSG